MSGYKKGCITGSFSYGDLEQEPKLILLQIISPQCYPITLLHFYPSPVPPAQNSPMTPFKVSFVQNHRGSCNSTRILLMANISHLIIKDVLFIPFWNVSSKTKHVSEQAFDGGHADWKDSILSSATPVPGSDISTRSFNLFVCTEKSMFAKARTQQSHSYHPMENWEDFMARFYWGRKGQTLGQNTIFFLTMLNQVKHQCLF